MTEVTVLFTVPYLQYGSFKCIAHHFLVVTVATASNHVAVRQNMNAFPQKRTWIAIRLMKFFGDHMIDARVVDAHEISLAEPLFKHLLLLVAILGEQGHIDG